MTRDRIEYYKAYHKKNRGRIAQRKRAKRAQDPEKVRQYHRDWYTANREKCAKRRQAWRKANPRYRAASEARRRAAKNRAAPAWANKQRVDDQYALAVTMTTLLERPYAVDHIVPLRSKRVCGLHTEQNLQILTQEENARKNNKWWPHMPNCATRGIKACQEQEVKEKQTEESISEYRKRRHAASQGRKEQCRKYARRVILGELRVEKAARLANCSTRAMYRWISAVKN